VKLNHLRSVSLSLAAVLVTAPAALALDANDFGQKLAADYATTSSAKLALGAATVNGNDVTFAGATVTPATGSPTTIQTPLTFHNVAEGADGSYTADSLTMPDVAYTVDGTDISVKNISLTHVYVGNSKTPGALDSSRLFGGLSLGPVTFSKGGSPVVSIASVTVDNGFKPSQSDAQLAEVDSKGSVSGIAADLSKADDPDVKAQSQALGITQLNGQAAEQISWSLGDGHMKASEVSVGFDNIGKFDLAFDITGYTPAFVQTLAAAGQAMSASSADSQAATAQLMAASQKLFVNGMSIRFDDASLTNKLLDYAAKQAGTSHDDYVKALIGASGGMTSGAGLPPPLAQLAQAAISAYLTDPHSVEIRLQPAAPIGVLDFMAATMQPDKLVETVGLKVLVNDKEVAAAGGDDSTGAAAPSSDDNSGDDTSDDGSDDNSDDSSGN
jgi:hypothetical protein